MEFKILDLFSGAGGFLVAWILDNYETVLAVDNNKHAIETFSHNFPNAKTIVGDILLDTVKIIDSAKNLNVNMIIGGPLAKDLVIKAKIRFR